MFALTTAKAQAKTSASTINSQARHSTFISPLFTCGGHCDACRPLLPGSAMAARSGSALDGMTRASMERAFGHDFSRVRVHSDDRAAESANALGAHAYTVGNHIVFGAGAYQPHTPKGRKVIAHELAHVVQQNNTGDSLDPTAARERISRFSGGGFSIGVTPAPYDNSAGYERAADFAAEAVSARKGIPTDTLRVASVSAPTLQLIPLPTAVPMCGRTVTDIDILPGRPRALTECNLPPSVLVTRINIVGRQKTITSTGRGRIIFNLHVGYYRDPATGRLCVVVSDSEQCLTPGGCIRLGCFPTLAEIKNAVLKFLKTLGIIILLIIGILIFKGMKGGSFPGEAPVLAESEDTDNGDGAEASGTEV